MNLRIHTAALLLGASAMFASTACVNLAQLQPKKKKKRQTVAERQAEASAQVDAIAKSGDLERLHDICYGKDKTVSSDAWRKACQEERRIAMDTFNREATCDKAIPTWTKYKKHLLNDFRGGKQTTTDNFLAAGTKIAKCGKTDFVFEKLVHQGSSGGRGEKLLHAMSDAGIDVETKLLDYMQRNRSSLFGFKHARYALEHFFGYLASANKFGRCTEFFPYAKSMDDNLFGPFNWFFRKAKCKGAEDIAVARLASDRVGTRQGACMTLGVLGTSRHLRKVNIVATTDPYTKVREHRRNGRIWAVKAYPVREACRAAAGKIQLRN